jgi:S1-C subfamily serine protease
VRTKEFLRQQGAEFVEKQADRDQAVAREVLELTGQLGVPVTTDGQEVIVGFDANKLRAMAARNTRAGLGLAVKTHDEGGALVGRVRPDSPAGRAGVEPGDVVIELSGTPIASADDLETVSAKWGRDRPTSMMLQRDGERRTVILYG